MKERSGMPYDVVAFEADEAARQLSISEEGLLHRMLRLAWMNGSIPADLNTLADLCRVRPSTLQKAWPMLSKFWQQDEKDLTRLRNKKQEKERIFLESQRERASAAGKLSAKLRKEKEERPTTVEVPLQGRSTSQPNPTQPNIENKDIGIPRKRGQAKVPVPDSIVVTEEMARFAIYHGAHDPVSDTEAMIDHFKAKGEKRVDWMATWRNWIRNKKRFSGGTGARHESKDDFNRREAAKLRARFDSQDSLGDFGADF